jgi:hypothetical protein
MKKQIVTLVLYLSIGSAGAQNYVVNGSFEYGLNANWSHRAETGGEAAFSLERNASVMDGEVGLSVQVVDQAAGLKAVLSTTQMTAGADSLYLLRFWARGSNRPGIADATEKPARILVEVEGSETPAVLYQMHTGRTVFHLPFKTTRKDLKINFYFQDKGVSYCLDGVEVVDQNNRDGIDVLNTYIWQHNRTGNGWTAGDNDVSFPLPDGRTIWFFNDSFYGRNDVTRNPLYDTGTFIRNAVVVQDADGTLHSRSFTSTGGQSAFFQPPEPKWNAAHNSISNFLWVGDAIMVDNTVQVHLIEVDSEGGGTATGKSYLGRFSYPELAYLGMERRADFCSPYETYFAEDSTVFLYETVTAGGGWERYTRVAKTELDNLKGEEPWEYWDGNEWVADRNRSARINDMGADGVIQLGEGNYAHVSMPVMGREVQVSFAPKPQGPWTTRQTVYTLPNDSACWFYMPNFHSRLPNGNYSISCSANYQYALFFAWESFIDKYWYRPRYIHADLLGLSPYSRMDCAGVLFGEAYRDACGECVGGTTGREACVTGIAKLYSECNFTGNVVGLDVGDYSSADLEGLGFSGNDLSSIELQDGYTAELFDSDLFGGDAKTINASSGCLDAEAFDNKTASLIVRRTGITGLSGVYAIRNKQTGLYMSIEDRSVSNGALLEQAKYTGSDAQKFELNYIGAGYYRITGVASRFILNTVGLSRKPKAYVEQWDGREISITGNEGVISAQYGGLPGDGVENLTDNQNTTSYRTPNRRAWVQFCSVTPQVVRRYSITSSNDQSVRDPKNWALYGSADGEDWVKLDTLSDNAFASRMEEQSFAITNETPYSYYRLNMECRLGGTLQLAEWKLFTGTDPDEGYAAGQFIIQDVGDDCVRIINKHSDMVLEVFDDGLSTEGAKIWQMTDIRQPAALWQLVDPDAALAIDPVGTQAAGPPILIYPNPVKQTLHMDLPAECTGSRFVIYNISGMAVLSGTIDGRAMQVGHLTPGYYILKIYKANDVGVTRFIKQ